MTSDLFLEKVVNTRTEVGITRLLCEWLDSFEESGYVDASNPGGKCHANELIIQEGVGSVRASPHTSFPAASE